MERYMKQYDKEYMKMKMVILKQEETFRHQVQELHRLYRVQKLLMQDTKNAETKRQRHVEPNLEFQNVENDTGSNQPGHSYSDQRQPRWTLDLELPAAEYKRKYNGEVMLDADEESDLELTLATGSSKTQWKKKDTSFTSDSGSNFSSSSNESGCMKQNNSQWALLQLSDISTRFRKGRKSGFNIEQQMGQDELNQPPWLFQCNKHDMVASFGL